MKNNKKKGFTLAELLIVVAIIAVLVMIAIPVFTKAQERSRESVDASNIRSKYATMMTDVVAEGSTTPQEVTLKQKEAGWTDDSLRAGLEENMILKNAPTDSSTKATLTYNETEEKIEVSFDGQGE